jgi:hypothetical protein
MQVDVFVKTEDWMPREFIAEPLKNQIAMAFRKVRI